MQKYFYLAEDVVNKQLDGIPLITLDDTEYFNNEFGCLPTHYFPYFNPDGSFSFFMVRWLHGNNPNGKKETRPYIFNIQRNKWKSKFPTNPRAPYNLLELLARPSAVVLIVEGEKCVEAAKILFPDYVVITSSGGANAANSTDWSYLKDREVIISPDFDVAGKEYFTRVKNLCVKAGAKSVKQLFTEKLGRFIIENGVIVERQGAVPAKYDLANSLTDGWSNELIKDAVNSKQLDLFIEQIEQEEDNNSFSCMLAKKLSVLNKNSKSEEIEPIIELIVTEYPKKYDQEFYLQEIKKQTGWFIKNLRTIAWEKLKKNKLKETEKTRGKIFDLDEVLPKALFSNYLDDDKPPVASYQNFSTLLNSYDITVKYNETSKKCEVFVPKQNYSLSNEDNASLGDILSVCELNAIKVNHVKSYIWKMGDLNRYNPIRELINSKPWDGRSRIQNLCDTIQVKSSYPKSLKELLVRRWCVSAIAAVSDDNFHSKGVLILQGEQSIGKSTWLEKLVPSEIKKYFLSGATLDPANKDSVKTVISNWIVELGELESTFGKDMARLKAFITNSKDVIRVPYAPLDSYFSRSSVFAGSVNSEQFLIDHTGNTRFWSLPVVSLNTNHNIDMQQLWAEVAVLYEKGEKWWLTSEEEKLLELNNKEFLSISPFEELLQEKYNFSQPATQPITATELLINLGYLNPGKKQRNEMGQVLKKLGVKINRLSKYLMPPQYEVEEKKLIDSENHYEELKNKQRAQILNTTIHQSFSPYEASIIINECTFDHLVYENKFVLNLSSKFNLAQEQRTQLLQMIKSIYGEEITIVSSNLN